MLRLVLALVVSLVLPGCPAPTDTVLHACDDLTPSSAGAACDFAGSCGTGCAPMYTCVEGRVIVGVPRCDAGPGPDAPATVRSCAEAAGRPAGTRCDFTESCMTDCHVAHPACIGGVLTLVSSECPDAGTDAPACTPTFGTGDCRAETDCTGAMTCLAPGETLACGTCMPPMALCTSSADCSGTDVCVFFDPPCSCGGPSSECRPSCVSVPCAVGDTCDTVSGLCGPTRCDAGHACPSHTACTMSKGADAHGCERDACSTDADCGCGACVDGLCYDDFGSCQFLPD